MKVLKIHKDHSYLKLGFPKQVFFERSIEWGPPTEYAFTVEKNIKSKSF
jgi:hypothetical protein